MAGSDDDVYIHPLDTNPFFTFEEIREMFIQLGGDISIETNIVQLDKICIPGPYGLFNLHLDSNAETAIDGDTLEGNELHRLNSRITDIVGHDVYGDVILIPWGIVEPMLCTGMACEENTQRVCNNCGFSRFCSVECELNNHHEMNCKHMTPNDRRRIKKLTDLILPLRM